MTKFRTLSYYSLQLFCFSIGISFFVFGDYSTDEINNSMIVFPLAFLFVAVLTFILQYNDLRLRVIITDNSDKENFKLLKTSLQNSGFQLNVPNQHYFKAGKQNSSCKFYFYLINKKVFYTYSYDLEYSWLASDHPAMYVFFNPFKRFKWNKKLRQLLIVNHSS